MNHEHEEQLSTADMAATAESGLKSDRNRDGDFPTASPDTGVDRTSSGTTSAGQRQTPLFPADEAESFRSRWTGIQSGFVDEPRRAVEQADSLIAEVMKSLASSFAEERSTLERQWDRGDDVSTEDLRIGLQRYRSFFDRLLSV